jgi:hypothetical protein
MTTQQIKQIPIITILDAFGIKPQRINEREAWYFAWNRQEKTASVKVNLRENLFYDFGLGQGGTVIDVILSLKGFRDVKEAMVFLTEFALGYQFDSNVFEKTVTARPREPGILILESKLLSSDSLFSYLKKRGINREIALRYCTELSYQINSKNWYGIGFKNDQGGYEIRNEYFKGSSSPKAITSVQNGNDILLVFEGFFDFLSLASFCPNLENRFDILVLNSVANIGKMSTDYFQKYVSIYAFLDNDHAGKMTLEKLEKHGVKVFDFSEHFYPNKDLNEWLKKHWIKKIIA